MLLVFVATQETETPTFPELNVRDTKVNIDVAIAGLQGWENDFIQTQAISYAPMEFVNVGQSLSALRTTNLVYVRRFSKVLFHCLFSSSGASANIRPIYSDKNSKEVFGKIFTVNALNKQEGSLYHSEIEVLESYGADKIAFQIESITTGTLDISLAGI